MSYKPELAYEIDWNETTTQGVPSFLFQPHTNQAGDPYYIGTIYDKELPEAAHEWHIQDGYIRTAMHKEDESS